MTIQFAAAAKPAVRFGNSIGNQDKPTVLHKIAQAGNPQILELLLDHGAQNSPDPNAKTPLDYAQADFTGTTLTGARLDGNA